MQGQIGGAGGKAKTLRGKDACLHAGVVEHADAKHQVGAVLQRIDVGVGLLDIQLQLRVAPAQLAQPRRQVALAKDHRRVDAHQAAGFAFLLLQGLAGGFELFQHQARVASQQTPGLGGADRAGVAIEQLLAEGLFHQLDLPGNRGGCQALAACHFRKAAMVQHRDEQA